MTHYVYQHRDPHSGEVVYLGSGTQERAWATRKSFRRGAHFDWIQNLILEGFVPSDWVEVVAKGLSKEEAHALERHFLLSCVPEFNRTAFGDAHPNSRLSSESAQEIFRRAWGGASYTQLALEFGVSKSTVRDIKHKRRRAHDLQGL